MKKNNWLLLLLLFYAPVSQAQSILGIEPTFRLGRVVRHTVRFKPTIQQNAYSFDVNLTWQTTGSKEWQRIHHYPWLGVSVGYANFGNNDVLGSALCVVPNINLPLKTGKKLQLYLRIGVGLAYLNKHYDRITDPTNDVIASSINNCTSFSFHLKYRVTDKLRVFAGGSFTHFSVGDIKIPNLGINVPAGDVGFSYALKPVKESTFNHDPVSPRIKRIFFGIKFGLGFNSFAAADGPVYPDYIGEFLVGKMVGHWNKFSIGSQIDYNVKNYFFLRNQEIDVGKQVSASTNYSALLQDEMLFGNFALTLQFSYFIKNALLSGGHLYQRLGTHYYFLRFGKDKHMGLTWGVYLTTHFFDADYVSTEIGFNF